MTFPRRGSNSVDPRRATSSVKLRGSRSLEAETPQTPGGRISGQGYVQSSFEFDPVSTLPSELTSTAVATTIYTCARVAYAAMGATQSPPSNFAGIGSE